MKKNHWILIVVVVLGLGLLVWGSFAGRGPSVDTDNLSEEQLEILSLKSDDWTKGATSSPEVVLVEYSDFQCPACRQYFEVTSALAEEFGDRLTFAYRHFPLRQIHFNAQMAGEGAEAAGNQGKFFEMHDLLFANQPEWSGNSRDEMRETLLGFAQELELDLVQFEADLDSDEAKDSVANDFNDGLALGVNATPTFFLNGEKINNPSSLDAFRLLILEELGDIQITTENIHGGIDSVEIR